MLNTRGIAVAFAVIISHGESTPVCFQSPDNIVQSIQYFVNSCAIFREKKFSCLQSAKKRL
jgi:hypothetical protein